MSDAPELEQAEHLIDIHRADEALAALAPLISRLPDDPRPHVVAARAHIAAGRSDSAQEAARHALALDPEEAFAAYLMAIALLQTEDIAAAKDWIERCIEMAPLFATAHAIRARIDVLEHHLKDALEGAEHAIELDPDEEFGHHTLGVVLHEMGRYRAAEAAFRHALSLDPQDASTLSDLAETLAARGRPQDAAELLRLAARADIRQESIQQDMLRYVRRAAGGLATWPIIAVLLFFGVVAAVSADVTSSERWSGLAFVAVAAALIGARERRMRRFPAEVRRLLNRRSRTRKGFEIEVKGKGGFRPWWWLIITRIPLNVRAVGFAGYWLVILVTSLAAGTLSASGWVALGFFALLPGYLIVKAVVMHNRAREPHPFYPDD